MTTKSQKVKYFLGIIELFLGVSFVLKSLSANPETPIVKAFYFVSDIFSWPFAGIFPPVTLQNGGVFDVSTFTAMVFYALIVFVPIEIYKKAFNKF